MSCNGCRVLRKGCSDTCILRSCLQWIESPEAQGHATVFVAKFFGRAGMMSFIGAVPESQRPALFQSLLYEACGRTINPVFGAVGSLWSGNWGLCQAAVETVLKGGSLKALSTSSSMSTLSKPFQPLIGNRPEPPMTTTTTTTTITSTKRSHCMTEFNSKFDIESVKRLRSSDQHKESIYVKKELASPDQEQQTVFMMNKPVVYVATTEEEGLAPAGQLVAPVARRVRPQTGYGPAFMLMREHQQQAQQQGPLQAREEQERQSFDAVELDLTLSARPKRGGEVEYPLTMRTSSPSSFSMNSEGSVISSDTAEFSVCGLRTLSPALKEGSQFIRLL